MKAKDAYEKMTARGDKENKQQFLNCNKNKQNAINNIRVLLGTAEKNYHL